MSALTFPTPAGPLPFSPSPGGGGSFDGVHNDLDGRSAATAHPISAITNLADALAAADEVVFIAGYAQATDDEAWTVGSGAGLAQYIPPGVTILVKYDNGSAEVWTRNDTAWTDPGPYWTSPGVITTEANARIGRIWVPSFPVGDLAVTPQRVTTTDFETWTLAPLVDTMTLAEVVTAMGTDGSPLAYATQDRIAEANEYDQIGNVSVDALIDCLGEYDPLVDGSSFADGIERPAPGTEVAGTDFVWVANALTPTLDGPWLLQNGDPWVRPADSYVVYNGHTIGELRATSYRTFDIYSGTSSDGVIYSVRSVGTDIHAWEARYKAGTIHHVWIVPGTFAEGVANPDYIDAEATPDAAERLYLTVPRYVRVVRAEATDQPCGISLAKSGHHLSVYGGGGPSSVDVYSSAGEPTPIGSVAPGQWGKFRNLNNYSNWQPEDLVGLEDAFGNVGGTFIYNPSGTGWEAAALDTVLLAAKEGLHTEVNRTTYNTNHVVLPGSSLTLDAATHRFWRVTMDTDCTFGFHFFGQETGGDEASVVELQLDGPYTPTFTGVSWDGGVEPPYSTSGYYRFTSTDAGVTIIGEAVAIDYL